MIYFDNAKQRWVVEVSRRVKNAAGETIRIRRRKTMPAGSSQDQAQAVSHRLDADEVTRALAVDASEGWESYVASLVADHRSWLHLTLQKCRNRARAGGYPFKLTAEGMAAHLLRTKGRCEVTGLRFTTEACEARRKRPFFHSIDRIVAAEGYVPNNVRVVCFAANMAMSNWGEEVFAELARGFVFNRYAAMNFTRQLVEIPPISDSA